jgi:methyl-accepting chemotaxis protein
LRASRLDTDYKLLPGTDPLRYGTAYLAVFERLLPSALEKVLAANPAMAFCLAIDRNGSIPVHNRLYSQPQRAGKPLWNAANARNKRIFDDRAGITAARSTRPFVVQAYARDMGGGKIVMMQEVDAPIRILDATGADCARPAAPNRAGTPGPSRDSARDRRSSSRAPSRR